jgi:hypothetical protein
MARSKRYSSHLMRASGRALFGAPAVSFSATLKTVQGLVFVGNTANTVVFYGLRIQGFEPACP